MRTWVEHSIVCVVVQAVVERVHFAMSSSEGEPDGLDGNEGDEYDVAGHNAARRAYTQAQPGRKKDGRKKKSKNAGGGFESMGLSFPGWFEPCTQVIRL